jgi:hypothetical protein
METIDMYDLAEQIKSKEEFDLFLKLFLKDCIRNCSNWENNTLERFFEALYAYSKDRNEVELSWNYFADLLLAAKIYE